MLLHFGAVDHDATVWVDGTEVVRHRGGFTPFVADLHGIAAPGDTVTVTVNMRARALGFNLVPGWDYNRLIVKTATARVEDIQGCP